jgi:hypothetical protein
MMCVRVMMRMLLLLLQQKQLCLQQIPKSQCPGTYPI